MSIEIIKSNINTLVDKIKNTLTPYQLNYGGGQFDSKAYFGDPYFVAVTDDYEYMIIHDFLGGIINIFSLLDYKTINRKIKSIALSQAFVPAYIDLYPDSHNILFNNGSNIVEYNIDTDTTTILFPSDYGINDMAMYDRRDYQNIVVAKAGTLNTVKVKTRSGSVLETLTLPVGISRSSAYYDGSHVIYPTSGGLYYWDKSQNLIAGNFGPLPDVLHLTQRGGWIAIGNETQYGVIAEPGGILGTILPCRTNVVWMMKDGLLYMLYNLGIIVMTMRDTHNYAFPYNRARTFTIDPGKVNGELIINHPKSKVTVVVTGNQSFDLTLVYPYPSLVGGYGSILWSPWAGYEEVVASGVTVAKTSFDNIFTALKITNKGTSSGTFNMYLWFTEK